MSYIQRLLDSASPIASGPALPLMPALSASSPVLAADQRLGVFPGLMDAAVPVAVSMEFPGDDTGAPVAPGASPAPARRERTEAAPIRIRQDQPSAEGASLSSLARDPAAVAMDMPQPARAPISPLQRLVESAPLHAPRATLPRRTITVADGPAPPLAEAVPPMGGPDTAPVPPALPVAPVPGRLSPGLITPDQFRPLAPPEAQTAPAAPQVASPAAMSVPIPAVPQPVAPRPLPQPAPLQPAADDGPSPFARAPQVPLPPEARGTARDAPRAPEVRVVERIRENPAPVSAPARAATAAAQSDIGPLASRPGRWAPRQEGV